eukprot:scaffold1772_cov80-Cylindrotheca_fusiformis.AAC.5
MTVPYLRNPNRSRRLLDNNNAIKLSKSTFHQEPEYYYSYHHHVGRRTKGGGGGGYVYGGSSAASTNSGGVSEDAALGITGAIILLFCCMCCFIYRRQKRQAEMERTFNIVRQRREMTNHNTNIPTHPTPTTPTEDDGGVPPGCSMAHTPSRQESNTDPMVLRKQDNDDSSTDNDDESDSVIHLSTADKEDRKKDGPFGLSLRFLLSTWRRPTENDECAICLEGYEAGQTICTATTTQCKHIPHVDSFLDDMAFRRMGRSCLLKEL